MSDEGLTRLEVLRDLDQKRRTTESAHNSFGWVVMIAKARIHSPAGERQFSHKPASAMTAWHLQRLVSQRRA